MTVKMKNDDIARWIKYHLNDLPVEITVTGEHHRTVHFECSEQKFRIDFRDEIMPVVKIIRAIYEEWI